MKDIFASNFQECVNELLLRNRSILDVLSKHSDTNSKAHRAICKSATHCGCIKIEASKQNTSIDESLDNIKDFSDNHIRGELCDKCKAEIESALGANLFYFAALCNSLGLDMFDIIVKEKEKLNTLGKFNLR